MKKRPLCLIALGAIAALALGACSGGGRETPATTSSSGGGIAAGATVGVALPWLGTQNWKEAQDMFKYQL
jgi:putative multiple sugar transport system substrate-binding protein